MKVTALACVAMGAAWMATIPPAAAQTVVSHGAGLSHDCYMYARLGRDLRGGIEVCDQALQRENMNLRDRAATYDNRGVLLDAAGRSDEAESDFHTAIRLGPGMGDAYVNLGSMMIKKRQFPEALDQISKGLELGMSLPHVGYYDRALAQQALGHYREAYFDYKKALELEPTFQPAGERLKDFTVVRKPAS
jgi:tetratricopeptide (TPR) repeat protein